MVGRFCPECGETRWHLFATREGPSAKVCPLCNGPLRLERRAPGRSRTSRFAARDDRRVAPLVPRAGDTPATPR